MTGPPRQAPPPTVSIVLPVRNGAGTLEAAIASLRAQTLPDWELLVVDDGSTDATPALLARWTQTDSRLRILSPPKGGLVDALNTGLAAARGRFIARMDADDLAHPERLSAQVDLLEAHPELGLAGTQVAFGGDASTAAGYALHVEWLNTLLDPEAIALNRFVESPLAHPSVMFRADLPARHGAYREGPFPEDYELWLRWLEAGVRMAKVPRVLLTWNDPRGRLSRTDPRYDPEAFYRCKAGFLARWIARHVPDSRPRLVWGAGRVTRRRADLLAAAGVRLDGYLDIDPRKVGGSPGGRVVHEPAALRGPLRDAFVLGYVAKRGAREVARAHLRDCGFVEGRDFLMAA
ncbi:MAG: putative glycosyltransferase EpsE [Verrucomicrobiota bacterium]|jgi:glycosyltransferase involved in cell wall biosynthesis